MFQYSSADVSAMAGRFRVGSHVRCDVTQVSTSYVAL